MEGAEVVAWVLEADDAEMRRAVHLVRARAEVRREVLVGDATCVEVGATTERLAAKLERVLGHRPEERLDCDVARYPLGRGWVVVLVEPPADELDPVLDDLGLAYRDVKRPSATEAPVEVCTTRASIVDPGALDEALAGAGMSVRAIYEVGGCTR